jgi:RimJ/RimL family protein N-acetyltransferase
MGPDRYSAHETLKDGTPYTIRAICREDGKALMDAFQGLDPESIYRRFFTPKKGLSERELDALTDVDFNQVVALVVTVQRDDGEALIGGGRYAIVGEDVAELAFMTSGEYRGLGIASLILKHLTEIALGNGLRRFEAEVLAENQPMLAVFRRSGLPTRTRREGTTLLITIELEDQRPA